MALRLHLTRFEVERIEVESYDAANEALFCVREDGMSMEEIATEGGIRTDVQDFLLEDLPADAQQTFLSGSPGERTGPDAAWRRIRTLSDHQKVEPRLEDPIVESRVDQRLLDSYFSDLTTKYTHPALSVPVSGE